MELTYRMYDVKNSEITTGKSYEDMYDLAWRWFAYTGSKVGIRTNMTLGWIFDQNCTY